MRGFTKPTEPSLYTQIYTDAPRPSVLGGFGIYTLRIVYAYHH